MNTAWPLSHFRNSSLNHSREIPFLKLGEFSFTNTYIYVIYVQNYVSKMEWTVSNPYPSKETLKKSQKQSELENKGLQQPRKILYFKKKKKNSFVAFLFALAKPLSQLGSILKTAAHVFKCETLVPGKEKRTLFTNYHVWPSLRAILKE